MSRVQTCVVPIFARQRRAAHVEITLTLVL
eukprot:COSAG05_NODE_21315_length_273_cov_0.235632_2_plen_29_part_01